MCAFMNSCNLNSCTLETYCIWRCYFTSPSHVRWNMERGDSYEQPTKGHTAEQKPLLLSFHCQSFQHCQYIKTKWSLAPAVHKDDWPLLAVLIHPHSQWLWLRLISGPSPTAEYKHIPGEGCNLQPVAQPCGIHARGHLKPWIKQHHTLDEPILRIDVPHVSVLHKEPALSPCVTEVTTYIATPGGQAKHKDWQNLLHTMPHLKTQASM
jgi:hypothetical protein